MCNNCFCEVLVSPGASRLLPVAFVLKQIPFIHFYSHFFSTLQYYLNTISANTDLFA